MAELNYHHLRYFRTVAHLGHLTRAAEQLNVSQSALSSQIRQLEARLGQQLFERRGRSMQLTEAGRIALDHADAIFSTGSELVATLSHLGQQRRALRIGALATLSRNFQLAFLRPILGRPDIEIVLRSASAPELLSALTALQLDLVLTNQAPLPDALTPFIVQRLDEQPVSLIGVPALCRPGLTLAERIGGTPLVLPTRASGLRTSFDALASQLGVGLQIAAEVDDMAMMRLLTREGVGIAVLPPIVVQDELDTGALIEASQLPNIVETFYGVSIERRFPNPVLSELLGGHSRPARPDPSGAAGGRR
jgi:LysR family transcriptional activator of nhaA